MVGRFSNMIFVPEPVSDKDCGDLLLAVCMKVLAQAFAAFPGFCVSVLPRLRSAESSAFGKQASFASDICEAEASGRCFEKPCRALEMSEPTDDYVAPEELCEVNSSIYGGACEEPDLTKRIGQKDVSAWLALAKNKDDDDDEEEEWDDEDDEEEDNDDAAEEEDGGDEGEGEEEVQGHEGGGGEDDDDDDEDDDENEKRDDEEEDEEDAVEAEDEEDEDGAEDEEDEDEEDEDDDEPQEPPQKKRK